MKKRSFDSSLLDIFHELQVDSGDMNKIIEAISNNLKISKILEKFGLDKIRTDNDFIEWCKIISENLDEDELSGLIEKINIQEKKLNLDIFK